MLPVHNGRRWVTCNGRGSAVSSSELSNLLNQGRYAECRGAAEALLQSGGLDPADQAGAYLALSQSLSALQANQEALGSAELAVHYARDCGDNDLLGRAICHSALVYYQNGLHKRAVSRLNEYFRYHALYRQARRLEGWVLHSLGLFYRAMGRGEQALAYFEKAWRWKVQEGGEPDQLEECRSDLIWQLLRHGDVDAAEGLLAESETHLSHRPEDRDGRARYWINLAYHHHMTGLHRRAMEAASQVVAVRGIAPVWKAQACLIIHHAARAVGKEQVAAGMAILARIQAGLARRPDLEEEATRSLLQMLQQHEEPPRLEELLAELGLRLRQRQEGNGE